MGKDKPGPKAEHVHIEGGWEDAVKKALRKPPPPKGPPNGAVPKGPSKKKPPTDKQADGAP